MQLELGVGRKRRAGEKARGRKEGVLRKSPPQVLCPGALFGDHTAPTRHNSYRSETAARRPETSRRLPSDPPKLQNAPKRRQEAPRSPRREAQKKPPARARKTNNKEAYVETTCTCSRCSSDSDRLGEASENPEEARETAPRAPGAAPGLPENARETVQESSKTAPRPAQTVPERVQKILFIAPRTAPRPPTGH